MKSLEELNAIRDKVKDSVVIPDGSDKIRVVVGLATCGIAGGECTADMKFSLDACRCVGACGLAPVMMINEEVYGRLTPDEVPKILAKYSA